MYYFMYNVYGERCMYKWKRVYQWFYCLCRFRCRHNVIRQNHQWDNAWCHHISIAFLCISHRHSETRLHYMNKLSASTHIFSKHIPKNRCDEKWPNMKKWLITIKRIFIDDMSYVIKFLVIHLIINVLVCEIFSI